MDLLQGLAAGFRSHFFCSVRSFYVGFGSVVRQKMPPIIRRPPIVFRSTRKSSDVSDDANFVDFQTFTHRLKKTLHYGRLPTTDRPSLPMTELAVELFSQAVPDGLGRIDLDYTASVSRNACISPCSMILAMAYIERLRHRSPEYLQHVSSSDLFLVSMMVASKFLYDDGEDEEVFNDEWAASADMEVHEVNQLEMNFLRAIDWQLYVDPVTFGRLLKKTEYLLSLRKVRDRGWATYTEADVLMDAGCWTASTCRNMLLEYIVKVVAVGAVAYVVSVMTIVGAALLTKHVRLLGSTDLLAPSSSPKDFSRTNISLACNESVVDQAEFDLIQNLNDYHLVLPPSSATSVYAPRLQPQQQPPPPIFCSAPDGRFFRSRPPSLNRRHHFVGRSDSDWSSLSFHPKTVFINMCI